jgi:hypothetical protein
MFPSFTILFAAVVVAIPVPVDDDSLQNYETGRYGIVIS